ncbi:hypothetical protein BIV25_24850 [Streptomyces sp. MUSC 14]|nr:hypothetical protein BIV25_24850 [Streptomyces sp. MUSC 14]
MVRVGEKRPAERHQVGAHQVRTDEVQPLQPGEERGVEAVGVLLADAVDGGGGGDPDAHRSAPTASATASVTSAANRTRRSTEPP